MTGLVAGGKKNIVYADNWGFIHSALLAFPGSVGDIKGQGFFVLAPR